METEPDQAIVGPAVFFNSDTKGMPSAGEIVFISLLMLSRFPYEELNQWVAEVLKHKKDYDLDPLHWHAPPHGCSTNTMLADAVKPGCQATVEACAAVLHKEGLVATLPDYHHVRLSYLSKINDKRLAGPKLDAKGHTNRRHSHAMVSVAELLDDRRVRTKLTAALNAAREHTTNVSSLKLPELRTELTQARAAEKAAESAKRKAERVAERTAEQAKQASDALAAHLKRRKTEAKEIAKEILANALRHAKAKRRDKAAEIRGGVQKQERARLEGQITRASKLRNQANARARTAEGKLGQALELSVQRLQRAQEAEHELKAAGSKIDEYREVLTVPPAPLSL